MVGKGLKKFLIIVCVIVVFAFLGPLILKILNGFFLLIALIPTIIFIVFIINEFRKP